MAFDFTNPYGMVTGQPNIGPITPQTPTTPQTPNPMGGGKNDKLSLMLFALGGALKGDKNFVQSTMQLQQMQEGKRRKKEMEENWNKALGNLEGNINPTLLELARVVGPEKGAGLVASGLPTSKPGSVERFSIFSNKAGSVIGSVLKTDAEGIATVQADPDKQIVPLSAPSTSKSAVSDPLRTITMGGKVIKNVRDSKLTSEEINKINQAGQVIQPLGFTEKFESSKDVNFEPIKKKYLATENIIVKTSELAQKFYDEPTSALAVGRGSQFVDSVIQNLDQGLNLISSAKDKKSYQYLQKTSTSLSGKDFSDAIIQASEASGVAESRIRDLGYLFAAARGQEGRGLSDKDFENALKIVSGGVGAAGRSAVLKDVSNSLRNEFYRDINFDIATSENEAYVNKLKGLPELQYYVDPFAQQTPSATGTTIDDPLGIR